MSSSAPARRPPVRPRSLSGRARWMLAVGSALFAAAFAVSLYMLLPLGG